MDPGDTLLRVNLVSDSAYSVKGHGVHTVFEETARLLAAADGVDLAVNVSRPADVTHIHTIGPLGFRHLVAGSGRTVVSAHLTPGSMTGSLAGAGAWSGAMARYLRWFYDRADAVLAVSGDVVTELSRMGVTAPVHELPNAVENATFAVTPEQRRRARAGLGPDDFVVLGVGQVQPRKGVRDFVRCAAALPDVRFVWVGGMLFGAMSAERSAMRELVRTAPPNVRFVGAVPRAHLRAHYAAADLFFLPSAQETFGLVVVEAAAAGLPLLLRDLDVYEALFPGAYVPSAPGQDAAQVARLRADPAARRALAGRAAAMATAFDTAAHADRLIDLYRCVAAGTAPGSALVGSGRRA